MIGTIIILVNFLFCYNFIYKLLEWTFIYVNKQVMAQEHDFIMKKSYHLDTTLICQSWSSAW